MSHVSESKLTFFSQCLWIKSSSSSPSVKRYVRKGIPNEHRPLIWMAASGAQDQLDKNPGYYQSLLGAPHDPKLVETICTGRPSMLRLKGVTPALENRISSFLKDLCHHSFRPQQNISRQHQFPENIQPMLAERSLQCTERVRPPQPVCGLLSGSRDLIIQHVHTLIVPL